MRKERIHEEVCKEQHGYDGYGNVHDDEHVHALQYNRLISLPYRFKDLIVNSREANGFPFLMTSVPEKGPELERTKQQREGD